MFAELMCLLAQWRPAFERTRSFLRVASVLIGLACAIERRTVSKAVCLRGNQEQWSSDYRAFSRGKWSIEEIFTATLREALAYYDSLVAKSAPIIIAVDDTTTPNDGRTSLASWHRDPLSPPFHMNLRHGLRFLHMTLLLPFREQGCDARALSVLFELAPPLKKPGKKATEQERAQYRKAKKTHGVTHSAHAAIRRIRAALDQMGYAGRALLLVGDGGYTNKTLLKKPIPGVSYLGRTRKDLALCRPGTGRKIYGERLPTPEQLRQDESRPYQFAKAFFGGAWREVRFKDIKEENGLLWQRGAGRRRLRLIILAPTPYQGPGRKRYYRDPAYLLTTDLTTAAEVLIQAYLDRWQIEVIHREVKTTMGVGHAQVRNVHSITRLHSAYVAFCSMLLLASLRCFGPRRTSVFPPLPPWRRPRQNQRPSFADLCSLLRKQLEDAASAQMAQDPQASPQLEAA